MVHYGATMGRHIKNNKIISVKGKIKQEKKNKKYGRYSISSKNI